MNIKKNIARRKTITQRFKKLFRKDRQKKMLKRQILYGLPLLSAIFLPCLGYRRDYRL